MKLNSKMEYKFEFNLMVLREKAIDNREEAREKEKER